MITDDLRQRRLAIIRDHMDTEVTKEFDATLATFQRLVTQIGRGELLAMAGNVDG